MVQSLRLFFEKQLKNNFMKTLIVTAHPSSEGFTHAIAGILKEVREKEGKNVEILDLYKTDLKQDFFTYEHIREIPETKERKALQQKITEADELVFIHPIWWLGMPAIMKNFIDQNFSSRFAYRYVDGKRVGLLKGKKARVYVTCDAPFWAYCLIGFPFFIQWAIGILMFCGISVSSLNLVRMRIANDTPEKRVKTLECIKKKANNESFCLKCIHFVSDLFGV